MREDSNVGRDLYHFDVCPAQPDGKCGDFAHMTFNGCSYQVCCEEIGQEANASRKYIGKLNDLLDQIQIVRTYETAPEASTERRGVDFLSSL